MQSPEQAVKRILDLDRQAECIRAQAQEEAESIRREYARKIAEEKDRLEKRIAERYKQIEAEALQTRNREIDAVKKEYADSVQAVLNVSPNAIAKVVDTVVARIRERVS